MNIAIFTDAYPPYINGVATSCFNLVNTLKEHGHNVLVVCPRKEDGPLLYKDDVIYMPGIKLKKMYGYRITKLYDRKVAKMVKAFNPSLIHGQSDSTVGTFARRLAKKLHIPLVYTYHTSMEDYTYYVTHGFLDRVAKWILKTYSKIIAKSATEFITPSEKTKEHIRSIGNEVYVNVIPTGIDFSMFQKRHSKEQERAFKEKYNMNENTKIILLLGRVAKEKSMDLNIEYFAKYIKTHPDMDIRLLVVGDGPQREEYELLSHELHISQYVHFIGFVPSNEVAFYYQIADIYTSASLTETQGLTYLEAMASGSTVLARFDNNLADVIIEGHTGYFFSDVDSFINKVDLILSLDESKRNEVQNNVIKLLENYSIERFYENILGVYKRALRKYW